MANENKSGPGSSQQVDWNNIKIPYYADVHVRFSLDKPNVTSVLNQIWNGSGNGNLEELGVTIWKEPFRICEIKDFLFDDDFVEDLVRNVDDLELNEKSSDLYKFKQSDDIATIDQPEVETLLKFLKGKCRSWMQTVTGFELGDRVDATFSSYTQRDYLLCHDDKSENRKIAFILYCNKVYENYYGGELELYDTDRAGQPRNIVKSILPAYNKFVFFEVSDKSYHRVAEVRSIECNRLSVNGWFYAKDVVNIVLPPSPAVDIEYFTPCELSEKIFGHQINKRYLRDEIQTQIRSHFEDHSESLLTDFLAGRFLRNLGIEMEELSFWTEQGPPTRRSYQKLAEGFEEFSSELDRLLQLLKSKPMFNMLSKLTGLNLTNEGGQASVSPTYRQCFGADISRQLHTSVCKIH